MAHSFVQAHDDEAEAFESFARARPDGLTLLIDTYDTEPPPGRWWRWRRGCRARASRSARVRLDSGDLAALSRSVRRILDDGGCAEVTIFASGGLDEDDLPALARAGAPIDGFGIGTSLTTSSDAPVLDCAYKLAGICRHARGASSRRARPPGPAASRSGAATTAGWPHGRRRALDGGRRAAGRAAAAAVLRDGQRVGEPPSWRRSATTRPRVRAPARTAAPAGARRLSGAMSARP